MNKKNELRPRKEIMREFSDALSRTSKPEEIIAVTLGGIFEVMLDIRDLLANPPVEVSGVDVTKIDLQK